MMSGHVRECWMLLLAGSRFHQNKRSTFSALFLYDDMVAEVIVDICLYTVYISDMSVTCEGLKDLISCGSTPQLLLLSTSQLHAFWKNRPIWAQVLSLQLIATLLSIKWETAKTNNYIRRSGHIDCSCVSKIKRTRSDESVRFEQW
jgi:hypothetical protein